MMQKRTLKLIQINWDAPFTINDKSLKPMRLTSKPYVSEYYKKIGRRQRTLYTIKFM